MVSLQKLKNNKSDLIFSETFLNYLKLNYLLQLECAANYLLTAKRADELSKDLSWKPGVPIVRDESKWMILVKPKARSVSILSQALAEVCKNRRIKEAAEKQLQAQQNDHFSVDNVKDEEEERNVSANGKLSP
jgi:hypothetical protein